MSEDTQEKTLYQFVCEKLGDIEYEKTEQIKFFFEELCDSFYERDMELVENIALRCLRKLADLHDESIESVI